MSSHPRLVYQITQSLLGILVQTRKDVPSLTIADIDTEGWRLWITYGYM